MKILISGASGLVGKAITNSLSQKGHQIIPLSRKRNSKTPYWNIEKKIIELGNHHEIDAVINLAGESIAEGRWDKQKKERILNSRIKGTELLSDFFSSIANKPKIFISGSAIGFYGDRAEEELTETSTKGTGFLPDVCSQWEQATGKASQAGIRVANLRFGMILSPQGGALAKMLLPFKLGFGGIVGTGKQYMSWVSINDVAEIILHIINSETLSGPINIVSPNPLSNYNFTKILGKKLHRPTLFPLPAFLANLIFGEMAQELLLSSTKVIPLKLLQSGYHFQESTLESALDDILNIQ